MDKMENKEDLALSECRNDDIEKIITLKQMKSSELVSTNPVLIALVDGVFDEGSPLSLLLGSPHILQMIWDNVVEYWKAFIKIGENVYALEDESDSEGEDIHEPPDAADDINDDTVPESQKSRGVSYHMFDTEISFPKPKDIYINMMPFVMARTFKDSKLPKYLKHYWDHLINMDYYIGYYGRKLYPDCELNKIGYLTIHESYVDENQAQRRPGLHTDCPGRLMLVPDGDGKFICLGHFSEDKEAEVYDMLESKLGGGKYKKNAITYTYGWGFGEVETLSGELYGGIYMASNVSDSCEVWDCRITQGKNGEEVIGNLGDVEHLREYLNEPEMMRDHHMYWITDRTPHESLPLKEGSYRQYFRLVTSNVSVWFEEHSTKNPNGVVPDPAITKIVKGSKFENDLELLLDLNLNALQPAKEGKR